MEAGSPFDAYRDRALELLGIDADETERMVMAGVWSIYQPSLQQLREADLDEVEPEPRVDLSQAPPR